MIKWSRVWEGDWGGITNTFEILLKKLMTFENVV